VERNLDNENFKQTLDDVFKDKSITPLSQLTTTPAFPQTLGAGPVKLQDIKRLQKTRDCRSV
jgi:hypothetical protein